MVFFSLVAIIISIIIGISIRSYVNELYVLNNSNYLYSVTTRDSVNIDDYYQYDAGICFTLTENANRSINAEVLMQEKATEYTNNVYWNANKLENNEVAISKSIADNNKIGIGDCIYSKHVVNGDIIEYSIAQIIPDVVAPRIEEMSDFSSGVIIMGFDDNYANNISHSYLTFTNENINDLVNYVPENIVYREDEIIILLRKTAPYLSVFALLNMVIALAVVLFACKEVKANFLRLIMLGFDKKLLNQAYSKCLWIIGLIYLIATISITDLVLYCVNAGIVAIVITCISIVIELLTLFLSIMFTNKRLWRK